MVAGQEGFEQISFKSYYLLYATFMARGHSSFYIPTVLLQVLFLNRRRSFDFLCVVLVVRTHTFEPF